jgi:hypothetical protein
MLSLLNSSTQKTVTNQLQLSHPMGLDQPDGNLSANRRMKPASQICALRKRTVSYNSFYPCFIFFALR